MAVLALGFLLLSSFTVTIAADSAAAKPPHIFFVLVDDLGWADVGFNRAVATPEVATPTIDAIVSEGIHLRRHYVHKMCTPTRTSVQSGRIPAHVSMSLANPEEPNCGIPRNMTGLAKMLKQAGYKTHQVGKWDAGGCIVLNMVFFSVFVLLETKHHSLQADVSLQQNMRTCTERIIILFYTSK